MVIFFYCRSKVSTSVKVIKDEMFTEQAKSSSSFWPTQLDGQAAFRKVERDGEDKQTERQTHTHTLCVLPTSRISFSLLLSPAKYFSLPNGQATKGALKLYERSRYVQTNGGSSERDASKNRRPSSRMQQQLKKNKKKSFQKASQKDGWDKKPTVLTKHEWRQDGEEEEEESTTWLHVYIGDYWKIKHSLSMEKREIEKKEHFK